MRHWLCITLLLLASSAAKAQERRAPPPTFSPDQLRGIFFDQLSDAIRGQRPTLSSLRKATAAAVDTAAVPAAANETNDRWSRLIRPASIEDEVKRVKLHFDSVITTPTAFNSGGYKDARLDLTVLATLFAVIDQHAGEVRWKQQARAARDLIARTAFNCKAGSTQVYNEAKLRKADLQDILAGGGLSTRGDQPSGDDSNTDWSEIADRSPLMQYAESLIESLQQASSDPGSIKAQSDLIGKRAELIAMLGEALSQPGMDDAADPDYVKLSRAMSDSAGNLSSALEQADASQIQAAVGAIRQRCDACHQQYR